MKNKLILLLLFPITIIGQKGKVITQDVIKFNTFCELQSENKPYKVIIMNKKYKDYYFLACLKTSDIPLIEDCSDKKSLLIFNKFKEKNNNFENETLSIRIDNKDIKIPQDIGLLNIPDELIFFKDLKYQYIVFKIGEFFSNTNNINMIPEVKTYVFQFNNKNLIAKIDYKSSGSESVQKIYKRFIKITSNGIKK